VGSEMCIRDRSAVETGVNEIGMPEKHGDDEFKVKKSKVEARGKKKAVKKKRKATRAARKRH
jgi:hypothetical protein